MGDHDQILQHRRIPFHQRKKVEVELARLEREDIIERVEGPTPWVSPILVVPKPKSQDEVRICIDMRVPNRPIERTRHVMPTLDDWFSIWTVRKFSPNLI